MDSNLHIVPKNDENFGLLADEWYNLLKPFGNLDFNEVLMLAYMETHTIMHLHCRVYIWT